MNTKFNISGHHSFNNIKKIISTLSHNHVYLIFFFLTKLLVNDKSVENPWIKEKYVKTYN